MLQSAYAPRENTNRKSSCYTKLGDYFFVDIGFGYQQEKTTGEGHALCIGEEANDFAQISTLKISNSAGNTPGNEKLIYE